jgi:2-polyprenyl-3-methyl-5-hydroxy-6-metoxy-1,4-benzoquinol methylase
VTAPGNETGVNPAYEAFHAPRFAYLIQLLQRQRILGPATRVLDIGASRLTEMMRERFGVRVDTLGFTPDTKSTRGDHYEFDLNRAQRESMWRRDLPTYDVVVVAEVIEHLYTAPELVLSFLKTLMKPGGTLVIQTPNAAAATRRIKLLLGRNPYERIRIDNTNPGHFREYTEKELRSILNDAGFDVRDVDVRFYFDARYAHHGAQPRYQPVIGRLKNAVFALLPKSMRLGMTIVAQRRVSAS